MLNGPINNDNNEISLSFIIIVFNDYHAFVPVPFPGCLKQLKIYRSK